MTAPRHIQYQDAYRVDAAMDVILPRKLPSSRQDDGRRFRAPNHLSTGHYRSLDAFAAR